MKADAPLALRIAARRLPDDARDEVLRELLEKYRHISHTRGALAAWRWSWRQPFAAAAVADRPERHPMLNGISEDLVTGIRDLKRRPGLSFTVIATIAISVGAIAAVVSVMDAVLRRPLPFPDPQQLVWVGAYQRGPADEPFDRRKARGAVANPMDVIDWARDERTLAAVAPYETFEGTVNMNDQPLRVDVALMGKDMNNVLRLRPTYGRLFAPADFVAEPRVVVLSHTFWRATFGGDPAIVGRKVSLNDQPVEIVGVLPDLGMEFPEPETDIWMPLPPLPAGFSNRGGSWQRVIARLDPGVSMRTAEDDLEAIAAGLAAAHPDTNDKRHVGLVPLHDVLVGDARQVLWLLGGAIGLVLLIACANVGHLLLVSAQGRRRELALRAALGARPARLVRLLFIESAWLAAAGGAAGLLLGGILLKGFLRLYPTPLPAVGEISIGLAAFAAAIGAVALATVAGIGPSILQTRGRRLQTSLRAGERGSEDRGQRRLRAGLVVTQVALSTMLLIGGALLVRTFINMQRVDLGFAGDSTLTFNVALTEQRYPELPAEVQFYETLLSRLRSLPGVTHAGATTLLPLTRGEWGDGFFRVGQDDKPPNIPIARLQLVTADYMEAVGLRLIRGRAIQSTDTAASAAVVVVNEELERKFFPEGALGRQIKFRGKIADVVGVVANKHHQSLRDAPRAEVFFPRSQSSNPRLRAWIAVRSAGDAAQLTAAIRHEMSMLDPQVAVDDPRLMSERVTRALAPDRFRAYLIGALSVVALLLAAIGLYGLIAYAVARDARDIAIRMALGSTASQTVGGVVQSTVLLAGTGVAIGVFAAWLAQDQVASFLVGVTASDPLTIVCVGGGLLLVAVLAAANPARRASRIDPATALRSQ